MKDDCAPAFPNKFGDLGMSLRDWFAGQALCMVIAHDNEVPAAPSLIARAAYAVADAMLAESRKP